MMTRPLTPTVPIVTAAEFAAWVGVSDTDPLIPMVSISATDMIINYLEMELIDRDREVIYKVWPSVGTNTAPSLSPNDIAPLCNIKLPYSHKAVADFVLTVNGEVDTAALIEGKPFTFYGGNSYAVNDSDENAIVATYKTGYGTIDDVPSAIKQAALTLAAYMYDHRGECDASQMFSLSGAKDLIKTYKTNLVVM